MQSDYVSSAINIKGIIPALAVKEFESDSALEEVSPKDVINLLASVLPEFGDSGFSYLYDEESEKLFLELKDLDLKICVSSLNQYNGWTLESKTDFILLRTALTECKDYSSETVMQMNESHPHIKLYLKEGVLIVEEPYYTCHGIPVLNLMDRLSAYLQTLKTLTEN
ncbi:conserved hypothetical protein [Vibrio crassostreae]|nr:conserved hypothetical protein [Vibrio chagasii]CAK2850480.1 conserved hypothetical protein [Vibrio crassostreae]